MRHVRILVLCLVAAFGASAMTLSVAAPALAGGGCNQECKEQQKKEKEELKEKVKRNKEEREAREKSEKERRVEEEKRTKEKENLREKAESKGEYTVNTWDQYANCPPEHAWCVDGRTNGGPNGGYFELGSVKVPLIKPVVIQGAFNEEETGLLFFGPTDGAEVLASPELPVEKGLDLITTKIQKEADWPQVLIESFNEAKANKETGLNVKIEEAGNYLFETINAIDTENLINGEGNAFELPLKTRLISSWLEKLGGGPCTIGSDEHPIMQDLTLHPPGKIGQFLHNDVFSQIELANSTLVDLNWPVEQASGATGCGGEYESYVDTAINLTIGLPYHKVGTTVLTGSLFTANSAAVAEERRKGHV